MSATTNQIGSSWMDRWNDLTARITDGFNRVLLTLFGSSNERFVRRIGYSRANRAGAVHQVTAGSILDRINKFEEFFRGQSDEELRGTTTRLKAKLAEGQALDDILPEAFAAVRESGRRYKGMRHYDVQMVGGVVLHKGNIAEMVTGEGKTLVATLPAYLNGLRGLGVHVITVNDYLARRDCEWMLPIYRGLGMEAAFIQSDMDPLTRKAAYDRDITYGTASEFGFDYLRDNMKRARRGDDRYGPYQQQCMRMLLDEHTGDFRLNFAIIDEVDNILIDEARTPLIISGQAFSDLKRYEQANMVAARLTEEERRERNSQLGSLRAEAEKHRDEYEDPTALTPDGVEGSNLPILPRKKRRPGDPPVSTGILFEVREKEHTVFLTEKGVRRAEELVGVESFFTAGNTEWPHLIDNALKA
ncbi:MAG: preprotein translocase subunit SecA, partial [Planctomycetota bacterium]